MGPRFKWLFLASCLVAAAIYGWKSTSTAPTISLDPRDDVDLTARPDAQMESALNRLMEADREAAEAINTIYRFAPAETAPPTDAPKDPWEDFEVTDFVYEDQLRRGIATEPSQLYRNKYLNPADVVIPATDRALFEELYLASTDAMRRSLARIRKQAKEDFKWCKSNGLSTKRSLKEAIDQLPQTARTKLDEAAQASKERTRKRMEAEGRPEKEIALATANSIVFNPKQLLGFNPYIHEVGMESIEGARLDDLHYTKELMMFHRELAMHQAAIVFDLFVSHGAMNQKDKMDRLRRLQEQLDESVF